MTANRTAIRSLFTEHEHHLTEGMPDLVAVGYVNARRRQQRGEKSDTRLFVTSDCRVVELPMGSLDNFNLGGLFGGLFGGGAK